jgi:hypothetical protein
MFFKLQSTAAVLKAWSKNTVGSMRLELYMVNDIIHQLDVTQESTQLSPAEFQLRKELKSRVLGLAAIEHYKRRQVSRAVWLKEEMPTQISST